jgi:hypothetical protein
MRGRWGALVAVMFVLGTLLVSGAFASSGDRAKGPDPVVAKWPSWPFPTVCGGLPFDPVAVFGGPTGAENGPKPSERTLGRYLRRDRSLRDYVPLRDWRLVSETATEAEFASGRLAPRWPDREPRGPSVMSFERMNGRWKMWGLSSACTPTTVIDDLSAVTWTLAWDKPLPKPSSRRIWINLGPGECSSGRGQNARARKPVVWQVGRKLIVAMTVRPLPPGFYTCEGVSEPALAIELPQPVGDLRLFDGATYPPVDVVSAWRRSSQR